MNIQIDRQRGGGGRTYNRLAKGRVGHVDAQCEQTDRPISRQTEAHTFTKKTRQKSTLVLEQIHSHTDGKTNNN